MEIIFRSSLVCDQYHNYTKQIAEHFKVGFRFFFQELVLFKKKKKQNYVIFQDSLFWIYLRDFCISEFFLGNDIQAKKSIL